jgi:hypothetical protein
MVYVIQLLKLQCGVWVKMTRNVWFAILKIPLLQELVDNIGQMVNFVPPMNFYYSCDFKSAFFIDQINSGLGQEPEIVNWLDIDHNHSQLLEWRKWRGIDWFTIPPKTQIHWQPLSHFATGPLWFHQLKHKETKPKWLWCHNEYDFTTQWNIFQGITLKAIGHCSGVDSSDLVEGVHLGHSKNVCQSEGS